MAKRTRQKPNTEKKSASNEQAETATLTGSPDPPPEKQLETTEKTAGSPDPAPQKPVAKPEKHVVEIPTGLVVNFDHFLVMKPDGTEYIDFIGCLESLNENAEGRQIRQNIRDLMKLIDNESNG